MKRLHKILIIMFLLVLLIVIALHILNTSLYRELKEYYVDTMKPGTSDEEPGSVNDFGGAPKIADPKELENCKKRVVDLQDKIKKDQVKREKDSIEASKTSQNNNDELAKGYETQLTTTIDATKEALQKQKKAEAKIPESTDKLNICLADLNKLQPSLNIHKKCCNDIRIEIDNFIKMKNEAKEKLDPIISENNALSGKIQEMTNASNNIINEINKCNTEVTEIRSQIDILKNT